MFSTTVNTGMSWKCWCTIPIPAAIASRELPNSHGLAAEQDLALVGLVQPEHRVDERALAGAVLAEEAEDLALAQRQVDVLVGDHPGERLGDAPDLEDRLDGPSLMLLPDAELVAPGRRRAGARPLSGGASVATAGARWPGRARS